MTKNIIVVGAGLGGLYTASQLVGKGVTPESITIVDRRAGRYTRPGHLNSDSFDLVTEHLGIRTPHSKAQHIKELERIMYEELLKDGVQFINEPFLRLQSKTDHQAKGIVTQKTEDEEGIYPAEFVFDCTGREALVAAAVNRHQENTGAEPFFKSTPLVDINPITDHLVAQVLIPESHLLTNFLNPEVTLKSLPSDYRSKTAEENIEALEQLQALGWPYETFPTFYFHSQESKNKVCLYMETPPDLPKEQQSAWIKLLLSIYSNGRINDYKELKPSQKYGEKPRIMGFKSQPHLLNAVVYKSPSSPTVLIVFDALKGFDYRRAHGVNSGIYCCNLMFNNIKVKNGSIQYVDKDSIERAIFSYINSGYKASIETLLNSRQRAIENGYRYFSNRYAAAANNLPLSQIAKTEHYKAIASDLAYKAAIVHFKALDSRNKSMTSSLHALNKCLRLLIRAFKDFPPAIKYFPSVFNMHAYRDICIKLRWVTNEIDLELVALDKDEIVEIDRMKFLINGIQNNFEQLDGTTFANPTILEKCHETLTYLNQKARLRPSRSFVLPIFSYTSGLKNPLEEDKTDPEGHTILDKIREQNRGLAEKTRFFSFDSVSPLILLARSSEGRELLKEMENKVRSLDSEDSPKISPAQ